MPQAPRLEEIKRWPAVVDVVTAGRACGFGRNASYDLVRRNEFPVAVLRIGNRFRVRTSDLVNLLESEPRSEVA